MTFKDVKKKIYFMIFILSVIFCQQGKKSVILTIFWHISAILEDFLTELEKINKTKKSRLINIFLSVVAGFFHFQQGKASTLQKTDKKVAKRQ